MPSDLQSTLYKTVFIVLRKLPESMGLTACKLLNLLVCNTRMACTLHSAKFKKR